MRLVSILSAAEHPASKAEHPASKAERASNVARHTCPPPFWPEINDSPRAYSHIWQVIGSYLRPISYFILSQVARSFRAMFRDTLPVLTREPAFPATLKFMYENLADRPHKVRRAVMRMVVLARWQPGTFANSFVFEVYPPLILEQCASRYPCAGPIAQHIGRIHLDRECGGRNYRRCTGPCVNVLAKIVNNLLTTAATLTCSRMNEAMKARGFYAGVVLDSGTPSVAALLSCARDGVTMQFSRRDRSQIRLGPKAAERFASYLTSHRAKILAHDISLRGGYSWNPPVYDFDEPVPEFARRELDVRQIIAAPTTNGVSQRMTDARIIALVDAFVAADTQ